MRKINKSLHIKIFISFLLLFFSASGSYAISPTPTEIATKTPSPTPNTIQQQINSLTNKIASRVAALKLVEKRGVIGDVSNISNTQITLNDVNGNTRFIDVDEFTKFTSPSSKASFGISDIKKGEKLGVLGLYNKESRRVLARFVDVLILPQIIHGVVSETDSDNFTLTVDAPGGKEYTIDVASSTRTLSYDQVKKELLKSGFSKIEAGQSLVIVGFPDRKDAKIIEATRIIVLPGIPANPKIKVSASSDSSAPTNTP